MVVRDVRHRWNYTHAMIEHGLLIVSHEVQQAIDTWVFETEELRPLSLDDDHWKLLEALGGLLKVHSFSVIWVRS
ncbi:hypothetical protein B0H10DRAFT_1837573 [Mycena sp. CBHHK59/15]|nr:hypothetical protein B0H10DRAFT_1837573 [Mycena sp. CBHHK59/15]